MRKYFKRVSSIFLVPLTRWYLQKERRYTYRGIRIIVTPGVFHPGLFHSTKFLLGFLREQDLKKKIFLELGCGTGLISIFAAKAGAVVTASDLSVRAIDNTARNGQNNSVSLNTVHSDLFHNISGLFDLIVINPPYYAEEIKNELELAWNCGKDFEYFRKLFSQLSNHIHASTQIIMVLTKGCDLEQIFTVAGQAGFNFELIREKSAIFDGKDFLYRIRANSSV
jgi:release factor glutamine methyltransferase